MARVHVLRVSLVLVVPYDTMSGIQTLPCISACEEAEGRPFYPHALAILCGFRACDIEGWSPD